MTNPRSVFASFVDFAGSRRSARRKPLPDLARSGAGALCRLALLSGLSLSVLAGGADFRSARAQQNNPAAEKAAAEAAAAAAAELEARRDRIEAQVQTLSERFRKIAFTAEGGADGEERKIRKWDKPITLKIHAVRGQQVKDLVQKTLRKLASLSGMAFNLVERGKEADINLHIVDLDDYAALRSQFNVPESPWEVSSCFFSLETDEKGAINKATIAIPAAFGEDYVRHCIVEEMAQVMGLTNDSPDIGPTIFDDTRNPCMMTDQDEILIRALYNRAIEPGMSEMRAMVGARQALFLMAQRGELDFMDKEQKDYGSCLPDYRKVMEGARMVGMIESLQATCENLDADLGGTLRSARKAIDEKFPTDKLKVLLSRQFDKGNNSSQELITRLGCDGVNYKALFRRLMTYTHDLVMEKIEEEQAAAEEARELQARRKPFDLRKDLFALIKAQEIDLECGAFRYADRQIIEQYVRYAEEAWGARYNYANSEIPARRGDFRAEVRQLGCNSPEIMDFIHRIYNYVIAPPPAGDEQEGDEGDYQDGNF